jgi:hypothetical protein
MASGRPAGCVLCRPPAEGAGIAWTWRSLLARALTAPPSIVVLDDDDDGDEIGGLSSSSSLLPVFAPSIAARSAVKQEQWARADASTIVIDDDDVVFTGSSTRGVTGLPSFTPEKSAASCSDSSSSSSLPSAPPRVKQEQPRTDHERQERREGHPPNASFQIKRESKAP